MDLSFCKPMSKWIEIKKQKKDEFIGLIWASKNHWIFTDQLIEQLVNLTKFSQGYVRLSLTDTLFSFKICSVLYFIKQD